MMKQLLLKIFFIISLVLLSSVIVNGAQVESKLDLSGLKMKPTADNPLVIPREITIKHEKNKTLEIGLYVNDSTKLKNAEFEISRCIMDTGEEKTLVPRIHTIKSENDLQLNFFQKLLQFLKIKSYANKSPPNPEYIGENAFYKRVSFDLKDSSYSPNIYVCELVAYNKINPSEMFQSKQFFLQVTS